MWSSIEALVHVFSLPEVSDWGADLLSCGASIVEFALERVLCGTYSVVLSAPGKGRNPITCQLCQCSMLKRLVLYPTARHAEP